MLRKIGFTALAILMAVLMFTLPPMQVFASAKTEYISEIRIGYGDEGKQKLIDAGYTVWEDLDANEGGTGSAVYLGYKTTTVKEDAITDIALMPMATDDDSAYSFDAYTQEMDNLSKQIDDKLERFDASIEEFRANYNKEAPYNDYALRAYTMLNMYIEDDTGLGLGDLFVRDVLDETDTKEDGASTGTKLKEVYHNIFMMGNSVAVAAVEMALAMGCTETSGETFLDRLADAEYTGEIDESKNDSVTTVSRVIDDFRDELLDAAAARKAADAYEGGREAYIEALKNDGKDYSTVVGYITLVEIMESIDYGDVTDADGNQLSFYDVMTLPTALEQAGDMYITTQLLFLLVDAMTPGQVGITESIGLSALINVAYSTRTEKIKGDDGIEHFDLTVVDTCLEQLEQTEEISVYIGVDRSVFSDYETIAITDEVIRENAKSGDFGTTSNYTIKPVYLTLGCIGCCFTVLGGIVAGVGAQVRGLVAMEAAEAVEATAANLANTYQGAYKYVWTSSGKTLTIGGCICAAIGIIIAVISFVQMFKDTELEKIEYTAIPRAIIDVKRESNGDGKYFVYYAARLAGASDDYKNEEDTTKLYGDLNGLNELEPWLCLYYAKDLRLGSPLTTKILVKNSSTLTTTQKKKYTPAHDFFNNTLVANNTNYAAYDLNQTSQKANHPSIYVYFQRDTSVKPLTSTIVDETSSFNWLTVISFVLGAGLATGATAGIMSKKYKKKKEE